MSGPYFSSRDQDEYDASQMSLKSLEWQTQDHPADCDCVFCEARERRRAAEDDEPETPTMPNIEMPEAFVSNQIIGHKHDDAVAAITARDAAIRAESAELLRVCGEALKATQSIAPEFSILGAVRAKFALAALKDAGVNV